MVAAQAVNLIKFYAETARSEGMDEVISKIDERLAKLENPSEGKIMRWLGFCQGYMVACERFTLEEVKKHSIDEVSK